MKFSYYKYLEDPSGLAVVDLWEFNVLDLWNDVVEPGPAALITRVNVPKLHRRKGVGTQLMQQVLEDADSEGVTLILEINPYGEMTYEQLAKWYTKLGFKKESKNNLFVRKPRVLAS